MAEHDIPKRYGIHPVRIVRSSYVHIPGRRPLTERQIRENRDSERNVQLQEQYNELCRSLVKILDDKMFLADSPGFVISAVAGGALHVPCTTVEFEYEEADSKLSLLEMIGIMRARLTDASLTLSTDIKSLHTLSKVLLGRGSERSDRLEPNIPDVFYRAVRSGSYSRHDKDLGFRSSKQPLTLSSNYDGPLHESSLINYDILKNHCQGDQPSDLIAMSDSPARVLGFVEHWGFKDLEGDMIAVIGVSKLLAMRVLFTRTTTLCDKLGLEAWSPSRDNGLSWVNRNYWVAYRWVPAECIEFCISVAFLRSACKEHGIGK
ncbi:uncharacterized protein N7484_008178 [Penicillium longicatenatum]|uniref:uncharacterized protein n=1 Tax=Penicillium longicatenatum TaxID=1561947 RepID=UPI00254704E3|nr:uncharacterized protein N7484_008178 [Penicillium longicatenatum]KAJ5640316.1 hypothetical protein N7484_008178 [Penicillium longicatenatum]